MGILQQNVGKDGVRPNKKEAERRNEAREWVEILCNSTSKKTDNSSPVVYTQRTHAFYKYIAKTAFPCTLSLHPTISRSEKASFHLPR